jgi:ribosomal protein L23
MTSSIMQKLIIKEITSVVQFSNYGEIRLKSSVDNTKSIVKAEFLRLYGIKVDKTNSIRCKTNKVLQKIFILHIKDASLFQKEFS